METSTSGQMLDSLILTFGNYDALQAAISKRVTEHGPMLRMEAVRQLWEELCISAKTH